MFEQCVANASLIAVPFSLCVALVRPSTHGRYSQYWNCDITWPGTLDV